MFQGCRLLVYASSAIPALSNTPGIHVDRSTGSSRSTVDWFPRGDSCPHVPAYGRVDLSMLRAAEVNVRTSVTGRSAEVWSKRPWILSPRRNHMRPNCPLTKCSTPPLRYSQCHDKNDARLKTLELCKGACPGTSAASFPTAENHPNGDRRHGNHRVRDRTKELFIRPLLTAPFPMKTDPFASEPFTARGSAGSRQRPRAGIVALGLLSPSAN